MITAFFALAVIALMAWVDAGWNAYAAARDDEERARRRRQLERQAAEEIDHVVMRTRAAMWDVVRKHEPNP